MQWAPDVDQSEKCSIPKIYFNNHLKNYQIFSLENQLANICTSKCVELTTT